MQLHTRFYLAASSLCCLQAGFTILVVAGLQSQAIFPVYLWALFLGAEFGIIYMALLVRDWRRAATRTMRMRVFPRGSEDR